VTLRSAVLRNLEAPTAAYTEAVDAFGTMCWLFRDQMLAKINAAIDEAADDKAALSQAQREEMEALISADMLAIERAECSLIWAAETRGEIIDFRPTTSAQACLGIRLQTVPQRAVPETSLSHGLDVVGPGGRR
jgi:hypothetical protein